VRRTIEPLAAAAAETRLRALLGRSAPDLPRPAAPEGRRTRAPGRHRAPAGAGRRADPARERARDESGTTAGEETTPFAAVATGLDGVRVLYPDRAVGGGDATPPPAATHPPDEDARHGRDPTPPWPASGRARDMLAALDPGRPGLRVLLLLGALAAAVAAFFLLWSTPEAEPLPPPAPAAAQQAARSPAPTPTGPGVVVYVTGKVRKPGVLTLPEGSRIADAIDAAGGLRSGARPGALNLARRLVDGEHIVVGAPATASGGAPSAGGPAGVVSAGRAPAVEPGSGLIDLNQATAEQLDEHLPGVGEVLARRIVEYREANGGFRSVEQLRDVTGIGERRFAELKDKVRV